MKQLFNFIGILAAGASGYIFEPSLRPQLTGEEPSKGMIGHSTDEEIPSDAPQVDLASLASLAASQLPKQIILKADAKVADSESGLVMTIDAGNRVNLVRIDGSEAVISPGEGPFIGRIPVAETDLLQQLAANPPPPASEVAAPAAPAALSEPAPLSAPQEPEVVMAGDVGEPAEVPAPDSTRAVEPMPAEETASSPEPVASAGDNDPVKAMQASIQSAAIKEFTFEQVLNWEAGPEETVDGESYQTGLASYKAETIFGVKTIQAKALIKDGKVQRWIWPKSGMEIK